ncbi:hypothetical protein EPO33_04660 [Patescibacteria group bacterium]|nr:MAG: hypothetical protein EPO33_04660 [Patescibacteria group bacterium]
MPLVLFRTPSFLRNFIFGVEDSLVSTVGLLSGVAIGGASRRTILLAGIVLIFVEAFSMGVGSYLSEQKAQEFSKQRMMPPRRAIIGSLVMFVSYFVSGFVPLAPYVFLDRDTAFGVSILCSLIALFLLGFVGGRLFRMSAVRNGLEMLVIGGAAILIGVVVGRFVPAA